mgnify:CR=1 FL=1
MQKLIASFWDVTGGLITIGDKNVKEISTDQLNDLISYVSQDNYLFNDTVRNNIRMGKPQASDSGSGTRLQRLPAATSLL